MAYIIQQRRDTLSNWNSVNPVLADAEIGFILDLDEQGKQKSSLYKIGDGKTAWVDLPIFGFNGNISRDFAISNLENSVPTSQSVLNRINNEIAGLEYKLINGNNTVEGLSRKLSVTQLVQMLSSDISGENTEEVARDQIVSRWTLFLEFQKIWKDFDDMDARIEYNEKDIKTLQEFADEFGTSFTTYKETTDEHGIKLEHHEEILNKHEQDIYGWEEEKETGKTDEETGEPIIETIKHKGFDEKISETNENIENLRSEVNAKHNILSEVEFAKLDDFSSYPDGTLFYTYKDQKA